LKTRFAPIPNLANGISKGSSQASPEAVKGKHREQRVKGKKARGKRGKEREKDSPKVKEKAKVRGRQANQINPASRRIHPAREKGLVKFQGMARAREPAVKEVQASLLLMPVRERRQNPEEMNVRRRVKVLQVCGAVREVVVNALEALVVNNHNPVKRIPKTAAAAVTARGADH
jgi:hypothetical protein